jgi:hypothetical protein
MNGLLADIEDAFVKFVKERIPDYEWKDLHTREHILERMEDDDEDEIRRFVWEDIKHLIKWSNVIDTIQSNLPVEEEEEEDDSQE